MSSIAGFTGAKHASITQILQKLTHWLPDRQGQYADVKISLGALELFNSNQAQFASQPFKYKHYIVVADCRVDNRTQLALQLGIEEVDAVADINYIILAYEKWGNNCINHLYGDFAFVIWDSVENKLFGARDHIGIKTLYYSIVNDEFVFSSEIKGIIAYTGFKPETDNNYFIKILSSVENDATLTPYANIFQVKNGSYFTWHNQQLNIEQYWEPGCRIVPVPAESADQLKKFNALLFEAVNCRLRTDGNLGAEVSGGLDSTGIAGIAMELLGKGTPFYSYCYGQPEKKPADHYSGDDIPVVEEFCNMYKIHDFLSVVNENDISLSEHLNAMQNVYDDYEQNGVPISGIAFLSKAKTSGVKVMLSGHGGDHVVTSRSYGFYVSNARNKKYNALWKSLRIRYSRLRALPRFVYYISTTINSKSFYIKQIKINRDKLLKSKLKQHLVKQSVLYNEPGAGYHLNKHDNIRDKYISDIGSADLQMRAYHHDLIGKHYNIEYRFPLLDVRLIEYVMSLPRNTVAPDDKMRYLFSNAIESYVPQQVISIQKSSVGTVPFIKAFHNEHRAQIEAIFNQTFLNSTFSENFDQIDLKELKTGLVLKLLNLTYIYNKTKNKNDAH
jgi:asparagine synthase (glutamine-hydrolysing)